MPYHVPALLLPRRNMCVSNRVSRKRPNALSQTPKPHHLPFIRSLHPTARLLNPLRTPRIKRRRLDKLTLGHLHHILPTHYQQPPRRLLLPLTPHPSRPLFTPLRCLLPLAIPLRCLLTIAIPLRCLLATALPLRCLLATALPLRRSSAETALPLPRTGQLAG